jgi:hypothetical protein
MKADGDGIHDLSPCHSDPARPLPSGIILQCPPATNPSPAAMALLPEGYAATPADGVRMRWRKKSIPARP